MKRIILILVFIIVVSSFGSGLEIPDEPDSVVINKVDQEHKNTRQFITNEISRRESSFLKQLTDRGDYYESSLNDIIRTAIIKLGLIWMGVVFFVTSLNKLISNRTEKKKYAVLKESLKKDIKLELMPELVKLPPETLMAGMYQTTKQPKRPIIKRRITPRQEVQRPSQHNAKLFADEMNRAKPKVESRTGVIQKMKNGINKGGF